MSVRRRRHTFTSCIYVTPCYDALKCRREACNNDSPRGGPRAEVHIQFFTSGKAFRPDRRIIHYCTAEGTKFSPGDEPRRAEGGGEALLPSHGTTACGATGGEEALLPIRGTAARAFERTVRTLL